MSKVKIYNRSDARKLLPSLIDEVKDSLGAIYISERGEKQAVLISYKAFKNVFKPINQAQKLLSFSGIWKNREELKDSVEWVNKSRERNKRRFR